MTPYLDFAVGESSQVGEARRAALRMASEHGFDELLCGRIALVATELGNNLVRHAQEGRLLVGCHVGIDESRFELLSLDRGPGMPDVNHCLRDGFSTGGTQGTGLGAVQRLSSDFSAYSTVGKGSVILARLRTGAPAIAARAPARSRFAWAGVALALHGETVSGDAWDLRTEEGLARIMLADGLGHGPVAAEASDAAITVFRAATGTPAVVLDRAHQAMRSTRGAAVAMAELDAGSSRLVFAGAGNISVRLISGLADRTLLSQHGTVGAQIRRLQDFTYPWPDHTLVVLHSDGISTRWNLDADAGLLQCDPGVLAGWLLRDHARGRDDATVTILKRG